jgi:hypothetical protein
MTHGEERIKNLSQTDQISSLLRVKWLFCDTKEKEKESYTWGG